MIGKLLQAWNQFWFSAVELEKLAFMRIVLASTLFYLYLQRQFEVDRVFTDSGIVPRELALQLYPEFNRPLMLLAFWSDSWAPWVHGAFVVGLLAMALGLSNRFFMFLTWVLGVAFLQRNYSVAFGADLIGGLFLLYLSFTQCCERWTLKSYFFKNKPVKANFKTESDLLSSSFYRIIQLQLCIIYAYTGFEKLRGVSWWDGTALWTVLANPQMVIMDLEWLRHFPIVIVALTFATVLFEIYFGVLIWQKRLRMFVMAFGFLFHLGIGVTMALMPFALAMLAPYVLFLTDSEWAYLKQTLTAKFSRSS